MTRAEFLDRVQKLGISASAYDLDGNRDESYVLGSDKAGYRIFYSERGMESGERFYDNESAALGGLLELLVQDVSARIQ